MDEESARLAMEYSPIVPQFELLNLVPIDDRSWGSGAATTTTNNNKTLGAAGPAWASAKVAQWRVVGNISQSKATVNTIRYIGMENAANYILYDGGEGPEGAPPLTGDKRLGSNSGRHRFRVVTNIAPPFVIESTKLDNNTCLTGDFCLKVSVSLMEEDNLLTFSPPRCRPTFAVTWSRSSPTFDRSVASWRASATRCCVVRASPSTC